MRNLASGCFLGVALLAVGCSPPRLQRAPANRIMSIGIVDGNPGTPIVGGQPANGGPPQTASKVTLQFTGGTPGPFTVVAARVSTPPTIDGDASDPCWAQATASNVLLVPAGEAIGMTRDAFEAEYQTAQGYAQLWDYGMREVSVRAAYDDERLYFLLQWADPTRSEARADWIAQGGAFARTTRDEDRVYLAFDLDGSSPSYLTSGCAMACHVNERLGASAPADLAYRFQMHTGGAGERIDTWVWRAGRTDPLHIAEDGYLDQVGSRFDCDDPPACTAACTAGEGPPCSVAPYADNSDGAAQPAPLFMAAQGVDADPDLLFLADTDPSGIFEALHLPAAVSFSPSTAPLDGSRLPGAVLRVPSAHRMEVTAKGSWANGIWTLELSRSLNTSDPNDAQFPLQ